MALRQKLIAAAAALTLIAGCSSTPAAAEKTKVLVPTGAPALGMLFATLDNPEVETEYTEGTDLITAELAKTDGDYDVIVAPVNLGLKAYTATETYKCAGVLTWGNLYMVGKDETDLTDPDKTVALFGEAAIPGLVYKAVEQSNVKASETWNPSVAEAQQALLSGQADAALLAEPAVSAAMAKDESLKFLADLQQLWYDEKGTDQKGYPQAAVFVRESVSDSFLNDMQESLAGVAPDEDGEEMVQEIESAGADKLGVPNPQVAVKSWARQNIRYVPASEARNDIEVFLKQLGMEIPEGALRD